jgi:hypothetical protein
MCAKNQPSIALPLAFGSIVLSEETRLVMALQAFFDESGKLADTQNFAFAGCVASQHQWAVIGEEWTKALNAAGRGGIKSVSMKDALSLRGDFAGWNDGARDEFLTSLVERVRPYVEMFVASSMTKSQFDALSQSARKACGNDPAYAGFSGCIKQVLGQTNENELLQICCDNSEEYSVKCLRLYQRMRVRDAEVKKRCVSLAFGEDEMFVGLQLADVHAYCVRRPDSGLPIVAKLRSIIEPQGYKEVIFEHRTGEELADGTIVELGG